MANLHKGKELTLSEINSRVEYSLDSLKLEFLLLLLRSSSNLENKFWCWYEIKLLLEPWILKGAFTAPFTPDLLKILKFELEYNGPDTDLQVFLYDLIDKLQLRVERIMPHVQSLALQLIRPWGGSLNNFIQQVEEFERATKGTFIQRMKNYWSERSETSVPITPELLKSIWQQRLVWPGRNLDGSWSMTPISPSETENSINAFWNRFAEIVFAFDALVPMSPLLLDQVRKYLSWHLVLISNDSSSLCLPLPVFPVLLPGRERGVIWLKRKMSSIEIGADFQRQIEHSLKCGIDTWISRNRTWIPGKAIEEVSNEQLWNSRLVLDIRDVASIWGDFDLGCRLVLSDRSAGVAVGVGIIGLLSGQIPNASVWCTGPISDEIIDEYKRRRKLPHSYEPLVNDAIVRWDKQTESQINELRQILIAKLTAARIHGIARRVVIPEDSPPEAIGALRTEESLHHADLNQQFEKENYSDGSLGIHPVGVPMLSNAADATIPVTWRKYRYINAPDIKWAFSIVNRERKYKPKAKDRALGRALLSDLCKHPVVYIQAPASAGKSYTIAQALTTARFRLNKRGRTGPRVAFIRIPDGEKTAWELESWRLIMTHLNFPNETIEKFLWAGSHKKMARVFVEGIRTCGIDILVLSGIDRFYEHENPFPTARHAHLPWILASVAQLLKANPITREPSIHQVLGVCEIVLEIRSKKEDEIPTIPLNTNVWNAQEAWSATSEFFEGAIREQARYQSLKTHGPKSDYGIAMKQLLGALSVFQYDFGSNGLYLVAQHLNIEEKMLWTLIEGGDETIGLRDLHITRHSSIRYSIISKENLKGTLYPGAEDSGPLIREGQGRWHIHPLIRDLAFKDFQSRQLIANSKEHKDWKAIYSVGRLHFNLATKYYTSFLSGDSSGGLLTAESLLPETLILAERQLNCASALLQGAYFNTVQGLLNRDIQSALMRLIRQYRETSIDKAARLYRIKNAQGASESKREWLAYSVIKEFLEQHPGPHHPTWWVLRGEIAEFIETTDIPPSYGGKEWRLEEAENCLLQAYEQEVCIEEQENSHYYVKSALIGFLCRHRERFRPSLPDGFSTPDEAIHTFYDIIRHDSSERIVWGRIYSDVGSLLWDKDCKNEASSIWILGFERLRKQEIPLRVYLPLALRALGSLSSLGQESLVRKLISKEDWFEMRRQLVKPHSPMHPRRSRVIAEFLPQIDRIFPPSRKHSYRKISN